MDKRVSQGAELRQHGNGASICAGAVKQYRLIILVALSIAVVILTTLLFLPVAAQPNDLQVGGRACNLDGPPASFTYPYPYPYPIQTGYCCYLPLLIKK